ncbi:MAG: hypothetical protein ABIQ16_19775 [Polyangiaceae bacterium]
MMNEQRPKVFEGFRKAGDGFASDVSDSSDWWQVWREIAEFVEMFDSSISATKAIGGDVTIDIAIEPDDYAGAVTVFRLTAESASLLATRGVAIELSVYSG